MPVLNEAEYIESAVHSVLAQEYSGEKELVLALGPSTDGTTEKVKELAAKDSRIRTVENPGADIPIGLNLAIKSSRMPIVVRVDAHSELKPGYTAEAVAILLRTGASNVGGIMRARGRTPFQAAVASAYNSPFGLGGAQYHSGSVAGPAESAYLGVFRREAIEKAGYYNEAIRRGEDWELNLRIRRGGGEVWFDPSLKITYWPRENWVKLVRQFFATGAWRAELVRRDKGRNPWRFYAPPALVLSIIASILVAILQLTGVLHGKLSILFSLVYLAPIIYFVFLVWASLFVEKAKPWSRKLLFLMVLPSMHLSWGSGFLFGLIKGAKGVNDTSRMK